MLIMTRETLLLHMSDVTGLIDQMQSQSGNFIPNTVAWFRRTEESLQRMRHPLSSALASERAKIIASVEGFGHDQHGGEKISKRKQERAVAVAALDRAQRLLLDTVQHIDRKFEPFYEKMAQFLAVSTSIRPIQLPVTEPKSEWLKQTWRGVAVPDELKNMYAYLNSSLGLHDRMFVLEMTLNNLGETAAAPAPSVPAPSAATRAPAPPPGAGSGRPAQPPAPPPVRPATHAAGSSFSAGAFAGTPPNPNASADDSKPDKK